jgi:hypothetical protein
MIRYKSSRQLSISEFKMPFEAKLDENNRWVVLSKIVSWEEFAEIPGAGSGGQDISHAGEPSFFERERNPVHRGSTGTKVGKRDQEQIPKT